MIEGWNSKHLWKHVCIQTARDAHLRNLFVGHKVKMIGLNATKSSNLSSHVGCAVFETRMVSIQERNQTPCMGVICGLRPKTCNLQTIISWSRRWNLTGPGHQRTKVDGSLQNGKIRNLQNPVRMWPYGVLGVKRCFGNGICTSTSSKTTPISWWPLIFSRVSQCTHMKEIMSIVSSRIGKTADFQVSPKWQEPTRLWLRTLI